MANVRLTPISRQLAGAARAISGLGALLCGALFGTLLIAPDAAPAQAPDPALRGHGGPIRAIAAWADGSVITGGFDAVAIEWEIPMSTARRVLRVHASAVNALVAVGEQCVISGGEDGQLAHWCRDAVPTPGIDGQSGPITRLAVSADGHHLAVGSRDGQVRLWTLASENSRSRGIRQPPLLTIEHGAPISGVAFTPDGAAVVTASHDGEVRVSNVAEPTTGTSPRAIHRRGLAIPLTGLVVTRDSHIVISASDGHVRILAPDLAPVTTLEVLDGPSTALTPSPDGRTLAVAGARSPVKLVDLIERRVTTEIVVPGLPTWGLAFSKDGKELFTGGGDRALRRWNVATGAAVGELRADASDPPEGRPPEEGARVFRACIACHTTSAGDGHRAGPTLHGIMGRRIATAPDYAYSDALKAMDIVWTPETIARLFEVGSMAYTPGTKMPEQRITDPADRRALVEWLERMTRP